MKNKLFYSKIQIDGRCVDLLLSEAEITRAAKRAYDPKNIECLGQDATLCWPIEKPPECSFWNRLIGKCK